MVCPMKTKRRTRLPLGRSAMVLFQVVALRDECCAAAAALVRRKQVDLAELEECARLDDALAEAHRILKFAVAGVTASRLRRRQAK